MQNSAGLYQFGNVKVKLIIQILSCRSWQHLITQTPSEMYPHRSEVYLGLPVSVPARTSHLLTQLLLIALPHGRNTQHPRLHRTLGVASLIRRGQNLWGMVILREDTLRSQGVSPHPRKRQARSTELRHGARKRTDQQKLLRGKANATKSQANIALWWKAETHQIWAWPRNKINALPSFSVRAWGSKACESPCLRYQRSKIKEFKMRQSARLLNLHPKTMR